MELFNLGKVPWAESQLIYEKVKKTIRENLRTIRAEFFAGHNFDPPGVTRDDGLAVLKL